MAEKEERILCIETDEKIVECGYCDFYNTMTRQEAIERMAKALYLFNREDEWYKEHADMYSKYMNKMAEAALNALLGDK